MQTHHRCQYHTVCVAVLQGLKRAENATVLSGYLVVSSECGLVPLCCIAWLQKVAKGGLTPHGAARISDSDRVSDHDSLATLKVLASRSQESHCRQMRPTSSSLSWPTTGFFWRDRREALKVDYAAQSLTVSYCLLFLSPLSLSPPHTLTLSL